MTVNQSSTPLLSRSIAFLMPLVLAAYWPLFGLGHSVHLTVVLIRVTLLAAVGALGLFWIDGRLTRSEVRWSGVLAAYLCILLMTALVDPEVSRSLHNWIRVFVVYAVAAFFARPLRHRPTERSFACALAAAGLLSFGFIVAIYFYYAGLTVPTYDRIRELKTAVQHASGIALNPLASATLLFGLLSVCLLGASWAQIGGLAAIALLSSAFTGSRAPLALALLGGVAVQLTNLLRNRTLAVRATACIVIFFALAGGVAGIVAVDPRALSAATEGRYDVWTVGIAKFLERPLTGYGAESWRDDLATRLPGFYEGTSGLAKLHAGGYHSEFVTLLAEGGLFCFIPALIVLALLFRGCCRVAYHRATPRIKGQAILFTFFFLVLRAFVEVPGLFGYGEDVTDYLAAFFIAIVVSRTSLLEIPDSAQAPRMAARAGSDPPQAAPVFGGAVWEG